eukprot:SAG31_NODE_4361_length_3311_cov_2.542030_3_plen_201_part_00
MRPVLIYNVSINWADACCGVELRSEGGKKGLIPCLRLCCGAADNEIGDAGAVALSKALESGNCKLTSLDVGGESGVAVRCVVLLSLGVCVVWTVLVGRWADACCGVVLRSEGGKKGLIRVCRLCCGAADNKIGDAGAVALSKALESGNCKLTSLEVSGESGVAVRCVVLLSLGVFWLDGAWDVALNLVCAGFVFVCVHCL